MKCNPFLDKNNYVDTIISVCGHLLQSLNKLERPTNLGTLASGLVYPCIHAGATPLPLMSSNLFQ